MTKKLFSATSHDLTPEEIRDMQGAWVREQCKTESRIEMETQARNRKIQRNAVREYKKSTHRAVTANDRKSDEI